MKLHLLELSLGPALALASFASGPDEVRYAPEKGLEVTRTCETSGEFELEWDSMTFDGEERLDPRKKSSSSLNIEEKFVVSDELVAVGSGRPEELARTFDELHQEQTASTTRFDGEVFEQAQKSTCDLVGQARGVHLGCRPRALRRAGRGGPEARRRAPRRTGRGHGPARLPAGQAGRQGRFLGRRAGGLPRRLLARRPAPVPRRRRGRAGRDRARDERDRKSVV